MSTVKENKLKDFLGSEFAKKAAEIVVKVVAGIVKRRKEASELGNDSYPIFKFRKKIVVRIEDIEDDIKNVLDVREQDNKRIEALEEAADYLIAVDLKRQKAEQDALDKSTPKPAPSATPDKK